MDDKAIMLTVVGRLVRGYRGRIHGDFQDAGITFVDVEFPDLARATCCADTMCKRDTNPEFEDIAPRMALYADLTPEAVVASIHSPVTLRFTMSDRWMAKVVVDNRDAFAQAE